MYNIPSLFIYFNGILLVLLHCAGSAHRGQRGHERPRDLHGPEVTDLRILVLYIFVSSECCFIRGSYFV